jgi:phosphoribosylformylglycinamidine cyclo-ligase
MYRTFNMGIGMVIVCSSSEAARIEKHLRDRSETCYAIGEVITGNREVLI